MMSNRSEANKAAVRDCFEYAARGDYGGFPQILAEDYTLHPEGVRGADGLQAMVEGYRAAISGLSITVDQQFTEGDCVATRFTMRGRHDGDLMGAPPSGREIEVTGLTVSRCRDGRIEEEWELVDVAGLLAQIGSLPESEH